MSPPLPAAAAPTGGTQATAALSAASGVIPNPANLVTRPGSFMLRDDVEVLIPPDPQIERIANYFAMLLRTSHAIAVKIRRRPAQGPAPHAIVFRLDPQVPEASPESYELEVSPERVVVSARETRGLFYGAVTLWQLCSMPAPHGNVAIAAVHITDAPRFRWRGLMLDSARHFQSPEFIMRYIDWMALHKLNVLGWHLTDDQGWRLEIRKYPRLTGVGAWRVPAGAAARRDIDPATAGRACMAASTPRKKCGASSRTPRRATSPSCPRSTCPVMRPRPSLPTPRSASPLRRRGRCPLTGESIPTSSTSRSPPSRFSRTCSGRSCSSFPASISTWGAMRR